MECDAVEALRICGCPVATGKAIIEKCFWCPKALFSGSLWHNIILIVQHIQNQQDTLECQLAYVKHSDTLNKSNKKLDAPLEAPGMSLPWAGTDMLANIQRPAQKRREVGTQGWFVIFSSFYKLMNVISFGALLRARASVNRSCRGELGRMERGQGWHSLWSEDRCVSVNRAS